MNLEELKELGLSTGEINVYSTVLELGSSSLNKIQEKTGIERRNIYDILNKLIEKGLISYVIEKGKKTFQCTPPNKILEEIKRKQKSLEQLEKKIPQIKDLYTLSQPDIRAEVYRGNEAIKTLLNEVLEHKESYWLGGNNFNQMKSVTQETVTWWNKWMGRRAEQKHKMYDLVQRGTLPKTIYFGDPKKQKKASLEVRQMPENFRAPMVVIIFGNKVAQVLWAKQTFAFVIESEEIHESYMGYFKYFWNLGRSSNQNQTRQISIFPGRMFK